ncbi:hypothetical protein Q0590_02785 [Rhodocytophaga aerolata]|uniref:DUF423 domain-containing protein n=1 Tax=Rhodocytophaga aerolata TaxID=455078 RepID=A0ABT8QZ81_9BACT|nr:hypothetical protein [Rhodocytophaga aerolata]MDO1445156.1 hypothetical protein [Rhodocytophaga aerolata]
MQGAGGSNGGVGRFFMGLGMFIIGAYLLLSAIQVTNNFYFGYGLFSVGGFQVTSGIIFIPFMIGVGMLFFNSSNVIGWLLAIGSVLLMIVGVISSTHLTLRPMSALELLLIIGLLAGGIGLFFSSFRNYSK